MKKYTLILLSFLAFGCDDNDSQGADTTLLFFQNATITPEYPFISSGENLVFSYYFEAEDRENVADDEFSETLYFEISPNGNEFDYSIEDLMQINLPVLYRHSCFCIPVVDQALKDFEIKGTKNSAGNWKITGTFDLTIFLSESVEDSYDKNMEISGTYKRTQIQ